ncbi:MAG: hypothetical protein ACJAYK_001566 [Crocinitomicaceae bacterium]|jgi:uncharacterized protein (UPF0276 family)
MIISGVGLGLRSAHIKSVLELNSDVAWFELLTDNWLDASGIDGLLLDEFCKRYPVALHSIAMNIAGCDSLNFDYLSAIGDLSNRVQSTTISDHLCFSQVNDKPIHDLAPIPYNTSTLNHVVTRILRIQDHLKSTISIENITAYVNCLDSTMSEPFFLNEVAKQTDCGILLDINNIYVNSKNFESSALTYLYELNPSYVCQYHLAGFQNQGEYLLDSHSSYIHDDVLKLYEVALMKIGTKPTLIEWDNNIPNYEELLSEYERVKSVYNKFNSSVSEVKQR